MKFIYILLLILPTSISANKDSILTEGYFVSTSSPDNVKVERSSDRLTLTMQNGSSIYLNLSEGALVKIKDPIEYLKRLEFHNSVKDYQDYFF